MRSVRRPRAVALASVATLCAIAGIAIALSLASTARVRPEFVVGRQAMYRFSYQGESVDSPSAIFGAATPNARAQRVFTTVGGVLTSTVVASDARSATLLLEIVQPHVTFSDQGAIADALYETRLKADLAASYAVRVDASGRIASIAPPPGSGSLGLGFVRAIAGALEIEAPAQPSRIATTWRADEPVADGMRTASYALDRWISDPFGTPKVAFHRTSTIASRASAPDGIRRPAELASGDDDGTWRLDGVLATLHAFEQKTVRMGRDTIARSQTRIDVELVATPQLDLARVANARAYANGRLAAREAAPIVVARDARRERADGYASALGSDTTESLEEKLIDAARTDASSARAGLVARFAALFYERPRSIATLLPIARAARPDSLVFGVLLPALAQVPSDTAQGALVALASARAGDARAGRLIAIALGMEPAPIRPIDAVLERIADRANADSAQGAEFALGSIARTVRARDPARAAAIVTRIERRLRVARDDPGRNTELLALGNAGDARSLDAIVPFTTARASALRVAAATALREIAGDRTDATLRALLSDRDAFVRLAAANAFAERPMSDDAYATLATLARSDPAPAVRSAATTSVWNARADHSGASDVVANVAQSDADASVRTTARDALAAADAASPVASNQSNLADH